MSLINDYDSSLETTEISDNLLDNLSDSCDSSEETSDNLLDSSEIMNEIDINEEYIVENNLEDNEYQNMLEIFQEIRNKVKTSNIILPQLCVFGDQSCGKSSLLESLTKIKFPVNS